MISLSTGTSQDPPLATSESICTVLPPELLQRILSEYSQCPNQSPSYTLHSQDLRNLACVSRQFQLIAERELYRHVFLTCDYVFRRLSVRAPLDELKMLCGALFLPGAVEERGRRRLGYVREISFSQMRCADSSLVFVSSVR